MKNKKIIWTVMIFFVVGLITIPTAQAGLWEWILALFGFTQDQAELIQEETSPLYAVYRLPNGIKALEVDGNKIRYKNDKGEYDEEHFVNTTIAKCKNWRFSKGEYCNDAGVMSVHFKENSSNTESLMYAEYKDNGETYWVKASPVSLNYLSGESESLAEAKLTKTLREDKNKVEYQEIFGTGINLKYNHKWDSINKELKIDQLSNLPLPAKEENTLLVLKEAISFSDNLDLYVDQTIFNELSNNKETRNSIYFKHNGKDIFHFKQPYAIDNKGNKIMLEYKLKNDLLQTFIYTKIPYSWLKKANYPIIIDPDLQLDGNYNDTLSGIQNFGFVELKNNATIKIDTTNIGGHGMGMPLWLNASINITIDHTSSIEGQGRGYTGGVCLTQGCTINASGWGAGISNTDSGAQAECQTVGGELGGAGGGAGDASSGLNGYCSGGSEGGGSATGYGNNDRSFNITYSTGYDGFNPVNESEAVMGSGAGCGTHSAGVGGFAGGGAIRLKAPYINISGTINMSGKNSESFTASAYGCYRAGGGGTIMIDGDYVHISGSTLKARGGDGHQSGATGSCGAQGSGVDCGCGGGGGGRIKIFYSMITNSSLTINASGGQAPTSKNPADCATLPTSGQDGIVYYEYLGSISQAPAVSATFPKNTTSDYTSYVNFTYNASDPNGNSGIENCSLILDEVLNSTDTTITGGINQTFNLTIDYGTYKWKVSCYDNESLQGNSTTFQYTRNTISPAVTLHLPKNQSTTKTRDMNLTYNASIDYGSIDHCNLWLNTTQLNSTDNSVALDINQSFNITLSPAHLWKWKVECESDAGFKTNSTTWEFTLNNAPTTPLNTSMHPLNNTYYPRTSMNLTCSGSSDIEGDTVYYEFWGSNGSTNNFYLLQNSTLITFNWTALKPNHYYWHCRANDNRDNSGNTTIKKFTMFQITPNCTGINSTATQIYNFTWQHENNDTRVYDVSFEGSMTYWGNSSSINRTITWDLGDYVNETLFCISPVNDTSFTFNSMMEYGETGYDTRNYFFNNEFKANNSENIILYLALSSGTSDIDITVTNAEDIPLENINVKAYHYDVGDDDYSLVQTEVTNPSGECQMQLFVGDYYLFKFYENGVLKDTTDKFKLVSTSLTFKITEAEEPLGPDIDLFTFENDFTFNNDTNNLTFSWEDATDSGIDTVCWEISNMTIGNVSTMYTECFDTDDYDSNSDSYTIPADSGYYIAIAWVYIDGERFNINSYEIDWRPGPLFAEEGIFFGFFILLTLGGVGLASRNPAVVIMMSEFAVIINVLNGFWKIGWPATAGILVVGIIMMIASKT